MNKEQITIRLPSDLKNKIQMQADEKGISFNSEVIILLQEGLKFE